MENEKELKKMLNKRNFYTIKDSGLVFLYALILPLAIGLFFGYICLFIATKVGVKFAEEGNIMNEMFERFLWFSIPFALLTQIVFICIYFCYNKFNRISQKSACISFKKANIWSCLICAGAGVLCVIGFVWLIEGCIGKLFDVFGVQSSGLSLPLNNIGWLFANLLILGVLPAICEELLFRGMIYQGLREKLSPIASIFLSALLFALTHQNIEQFIYPFILGSMFALIFEKTGNLIYPIIFHMFNNFTTIILTYLIETNVLKLSFSVTWWGVLCAILLAAATCGILYLVWRFYFKNHKKIERQIEGENKQTPPILMGKVPFTLVCGIILCLIMIVINAI